MNHPLTDEICTEVADSMIDFPNGFPDAHDHMRAGADWQLKQMIEWLRGNLSSLEEDGSSRYIRIAHQHYTQFRYLIDQEKVIDDLKKAMRPQEDNQ